MKKISLFFALVCGLAALAGDNLLKDPLSIANPQTTVYKDGVYTMTNPDKSVRSVVYQVVTVDQKSPKPIYFSAEAKAEDNTGNSGCYFGVLVHLTYQDGSRTNGINFGMGGDTFDWTKRERTYVPAKPVKTIRYEAQYMRNKGKVHFRNLQLTEGAPKAAARPGTRTNAKIGNFKITLKDRHADTFLVQNGKAQAAIIGDAKLAARLNAVIKAKTGVKLPVLAHTAYENAEQLDRNLIVIGSRDNNRTMSNLYNRHFALIDDKYPGPGGYDVHSVHNPFGDLHNVILTGGSSAEGDALAVGKLIAHVKKCPAGKNLKLGFISDAKLSPSYKVARNVKDIPLWECSFGYGNKGYFGWNMLARNLAMLYITNDPYYKNEFMRLAFPKDKATQDELFKIDDEAYADRREPIVSVYHYRGQFMTLYWDMVDENPLFTDDERLQVTQKLYEQLCYRLTRTDYTNPYNNYSTRKLTRPDRHHTWELLLAYTTARYLIKDYPACYEALEGLRLARNGMEPMFEKPITDNIAFFWVCTGVEMPIYYGCLQGHRLVNSPAAKAYAKTMTLISTMGRGSDCRTELYAAPWMFLAGGYLAQDQAMITLLQNKNTSGMFDAKTVHDASVFRVGQSFWPAKPYPNDSIRDNAGKWNTLAMYIPQNPSKTENIFTSYRSKSDDSGDFLMVDPHYSLGLRDRQHNFAMMFAHLNGLPLLYGYGNALTPFADGLAVGKFPMDARLTRQGAANGFAWITGLVPDFNGFDWERTWLLKEGKYLVAIDRLTAKKDMKSARFDIKFAAGFRGKVTAQENGDFSASARWYDREGTFVWSFADDCAAPWSKFTWDTYLSGDSITFKPEAKNVAKGAEYTFVTLFRPGKAAAMRGTARDGNTFALATPAPALLTLDQDGFILTDKDTAFTLKDKPAFASGDAASAAKAQAMLAKREKKQYVVPALPGRIGQARWIAEIGGAAVGQAFQADGKMMLCAGKTVLLLDPKTGREILRKTMPGNVTAMAYEPQTKLWLAGTFNDILTAFDETGRVRWTFKSEMAEAVSHYGPYWHKKAVPGVRSLFVKNGRIYLGGAGTVEVLDGNGELLARKEVLYAGVEKLLLNPASGNIILIRHSGGAIIHEIDESFSVRPHTLWSFGLRDSLNSYGFNMVGQWDIRFFKGTDGKWYAADLLTGAQNRLVIRTAEGQVQYEADFGPGNRGHGIMIPNDGGRTLRNIEMADLNGDGTPEICVTHFDGSVYIFNTKAEVLALYNVHSVPRSLATDGKAFYIGLDNGRIVKVDANGPKVIGKMDGTVFVLECTENGLIAGSASGEVAGYRK